MYSHPGIQSGAGGRGSECMMCNTRALIELRQSKRDSLMQGELRLGGPRKCLLQIRQ